jgi:hypothetical protein
MAILLVVSSAIFALLNPAQGTFRAQPEVADMQQRLRVAADVLAKDLMMAGAGMYSGAAAGPLVGFFPPILPQRRGAVQPDPSLSWFSDRITIIYVPATPLQTLVASEMNGPSAPIAVAQRPGCPRGDHLCGFRRGMRAVLFDDRGAFDTFTITETRESGLEHGPPNPPLSKAYGPSENARIAEVVTTTYYLDPATSQLRRYDGYQTDAPLVDNVVALGFTYFGDPRPPLSPRPSSGEENCLFDAAGSPRLSVLPVTGGSLVELTPELLTDGPVCGQPPNTFDADLYRIRAVRVSLRVQVAGLALRGSDPVLFHTPGTATGTSRYVPDYQITFEVTPRNLNLNR